MLITYHDLINRYGIKVSGILHVGAHECEELKDYLNGGVASNNIYWVEGQEVLVNDMKNRGIPNIYHALIDDEDDKEVTFNISNNGQSSSILEFGSHSIHHPHVHYVSSHKQKTIRLDTLIEKNNIPMDRLNFLNLDIQGVELRALKSMEKYLGNVKYIYTEVNTEEVYKECDTIDAIDNYLQQFGFERCDARIYKQFGWGDAFYIKK
jgi:FkbM family methyltransferase